MNHNSNKDDFNDDDDSEICFKKEKICSGKCNLSFLKIMCIIS